MEVGSHGVDHRMLAKLPPAQMRDEIETSRRTLERELGIAPQVISYPVGGHDAYDDSVIDAARAAGFRLGCSYIAGAEALRAQDAFALRRIPVERQMDAAWFESMLALPEVFCYRSRGRTG
jgi:peptidoglycan/xylan/chitin deacetylase (PgdA/CDA1 family)